jgi:hypothetical protein
MQVPLVVRTHYQVDEPAYVELLVREATTPTASRYKEQVASAFAAALGRRGRRLNVAAGEYAVDLARSLEVLTEGNSWATQGHFVSLASTLNGTESDWLELDQPRKLMHFFVFCEHDGAALLFLAQRLLEAGKLDGHSPTWSELATEMYDTVLRHYTAAAALTSDRVSLRQQLERVRVSPYRGRSGSHKMFLHLQVLTRLGLAIQEPGSARTYVAPARASETELGRFVAALPDFDALDAELRKGTWADLAALVYGLSAQAPDEDTDDVMRILVPLYERLLETGMPHCPIAPIASAAQVRLLAGGAGILRPEQVMAAIEDVKRTDPKSVRFHVDRSGRPAYVRLDESIVERFRPH